MREGPALLKWVYQPRNNTFSELHKNTLINHFPHSHILTTKLGLCKTLRGERTALINDFGKTHLRFYPRSYDLRYIYLINSQWGKLGLCKGFQTDCYCKPIQKNDDSHRNLRRTVFCKAERGDLRVLKEPIGELAEITASPVLKKINLLKRSSDQQILPSKRQNLRVLAVLSVPDVHTWLPGQRGDGQRKLDQQLDCL